MSTFHWRVSKATFCSPKRSGVEHLVLADGLCSTPADGRSVVGRQAENETARKGRTLAPRRQSGQHGLTIARRAFNVELDPMVTAPALSNSMKCPHHAGENHRELELRPQFLDARSEPLSSDSRALDSNSKQAKPRALGVSRDRLYAGLFAEELRNPCGFSGLIPRSVRIRWDRSTGLLSYPGLCGLERRARPAMDGSYED